MIQLIFTKLTSECNGFVDFRSLICDHVWIHCNLIASLIMAQLVFLFGIEATENKVNTEHNTEHLSCIDLYGEQFRTDREYLIFYLRLVFLCRVYVGQLP